MKSVEAGIIRKFGANLPGAIFPPEPKTWSCRHNTQETKDQGHQSLGFGDLLEVFCGFSFTMASLSFFMMVFILHPHIIKCMNVLRRTLYAISTQIIHVWSSLVEKLFTLIDIFRDFHQLYIINLLHHLNIVQALQRTAENISNNLCGRAQMY